MTAFVDRWISPSSFPMEIHALRRARIVVIGAWLGLGAYVTLLIALTLGQAPPLPVAQSVFAIVLTAGALGVVRWKGLVEPAAWFVTLSLVLTPIAQASVDLGIRDPALALMMLAPLAGALMSGTRLAVAAAVVGIAAAVMLYGLDAAGFAPEPYSGPAEIAAYALAIAISACILTATTGILYVRHTRQQITEAEGQSTRLDAALRASEERYRSLFDHVPTGMYRTAPDGRVLLANAALARLIGAPSAEAARAYRATDFYADPADRERFRETILRDGSVRRFETRWRRPDGGIRHVRLDARVALDADGEPLFYEGAVEDVTAEREARLALHRSEARFRALVQRSSDVVVVADVSHRLTYVSPSIGPLLGYTPESATGLALAALVHPDDQATATAFLEATRAGTHPPQVGLRMRHAQGHDVFVEGAASALYDDPAVGGLVLNFRDVTERMRAQAVLVQARRQAEEVAALKSTFLANMSHEIRTPLTAILGFSEVLSEEVTDETQREFVDLIARSGQRLMHTLNSVLDIARLDSSGGQIEGTALDTVALVRETVEMFGPAAAEIGLTIRAEVPEAPLDVVADEAALVRVLHNLIGNALKFTDRGEVVLSVAPEPGDPQRVAFVVRDTGIGIDAAFLPRIFGEFEQESIGHGRRYEGAGLGLALSRQMVERMSGTISVDSEKGVGTAFTVSLPATREVEPPSDERPTVLVVDDNEQARKVAVHTLGSTFLVVQAIDGDGALAAVERERPNVALLDIHLGASISGEDVMRRLRASDAFAALPMVAVTAYGLPGDRERFLAAGFDAYLTKPYARADLHQAVEGAIARRSSRTSTLDGGAFVARPSPQASDASPQASDASPPLRVPPVPRT